MLNKFVVVVVVVVVVCVCVCVRGGGGLGAKNSFFSVTLYKPPPRSLTHEIICSAQYHNTVIFISLSTTGSLVVLLFYFTNVKINSSHCFP